MKAFLLKLLRVMVPLALLVSALGVAAALVTTAPKTQRSNEVRQAPLLEVVPVSQQPLQRIVEADGTVMPAQQVTIAPEVPGRIVAIHPALEPGGIVREGEVLMRIDPAEYELAVARAEGALAEARAALEVERGRQLVAEREWELFGKDLPDAARGQALALREPQLKQAEARIASAKSEVESAKLNLTRTTIYVPFDAIVLEESADVGQLASPGTRVATLAGTDAFWVQVSVPRARLGPLLRAAEEGRSEVRIFDLNRMHSPIPGQVLRHLGQVDPEGRMAQLLLRVNDPLALEASHEDRDPLPLNSYVRAELDAGILEDAVPVPRKALRENGLVWVADANNRFRERRAEILWSQGEVLALRNTFETGDQLVVSAVADLVPGMEVRTRIEADQVVADPDELVDSDVAS